MEILLGIGAIVLIARIIKECASPIYPAIDDWELYWEDHKIYDDEQIKKFRLQGRYNHRKNWLKRGWLVWDWRELKNIQLKIFTNCRKEQGQN